MSEPTPNADSLLRAAIAFAVVEMDMEGELPPSKRAWLNMAMAYAKSKDEPPAAVQAGERERLRKAMDDIEFWTRQDRANHNAPMAKRMRGEARAKILSIFEKSPAPVQAGDVREAHRAREILIREARRHGRCYWAERKGDGGYPGPLIFKERRRACLHVLTILKGVKTAVIPQPPALTALVEAAREALESLDGLANVTTGIFLNADYQAKHRLRAALTPFLDPAQPKQEAPNGR